MANPSTAASSQGPSATTTKSHTKNGKNSRGKAKSAAAGDAARIENGLHKISDNGVAPSASQTINNMKAKAKAKVLSTVDGDKGEAVANGVGNGGLQAPAMADVSPPVMSYSHKLKSKLNAKKTDTPSDLSSSAAQKVRTENGGSLRIETCSRVVEAVDVVKKQSDAKRDGACVSNVGNSPLPSSSVVGGAAAAATAASRVDSVQKHGETAPKVGKNGSLNGGHSDKAPALPAMPAQRSRGRNRCRKRNGGNKGNSTEDGTIANGNGAEGQGPSNRSSSDRGDTEVKLDVKNGSNGVASSNNENIKKDNTTGQQKTSKQNQTSSKKKGNARKQKESGAKAATVSNGVAEVQKEKEVKLQPASESVMRPLDVSKESAGKISGVILVATTDVNACEILETVVQDVETARVLDAAPLSAAAANETDLNVYAEVFVSLSEKASNCTSPMPSEEGEASQTVSPLSNSPIISADESDQPKIHLPSDAIEIKLPEESPEIAASSPADAASSTISDTPPEDSAETVPTGVTGVLPVSGMQLNPLACEFTPRLGGSFLNSADTQTFPSPGHFDVKQVHPHLTGTSYATQKQEEYVSYNGLPYGVSYLNMTTTAEDYNMQPWSEGHDYDEDSMVPGYPESSTIRLPVASVNASGHTSGTATPLPVYHDCLTTPVTFPNNHFLVSTTSGHTSGTATPASLYHNPPNTPAIFPNHLLLPATTAEGVSSTVVTRTATTPVSSVVYLHYHDNPDIYQDVVSRLESHMQRQTNEAVSSSVCVSDKAECKEGYYVEEQLPASSTISPAPLPITASVAGAEDLINTTSSSAFNSPLLEQATPAEASDIEEGLVESVVDVVGGSGDLSSSKDRKMEAGLEKNSEETTGVKKECLSATDAAHSDPSATLEVGSDVAMPASDTVKSSSSSTPSLQDTLPNSNGVAEITEEAVPCSSGIKSLESAAPDSVGDMSPETSPQMAPFPDTNSAQPAASSTVSPAPLPGAAAAATPPQQLSPAVQISALPNGEAGAEAPTQPSSTGDPATDAILKALTPHIQNLFNLKTFMNHAQLKDHLDGELYVATSHLLQIPEFQAITSSMELLSQALRNDPIDVEFDDNGNRVRCRNKRNVVIVRELSNTEYTKDDVKTIFHSENDSCPEVLHVEYANFGCWYTYFACENDAVTSLAFLNQRKFNGRRIYAGMKSSQPTARVPYTPVKPNLPNGMGGSMPTQHQGPGSVGAQGQVSGGPPPLSAMYGGRPLPTSSASGVLPQQQPAPVPAGTSAAPPASLMYSNAHNPVMHNAAAPGIYPSPYFNLPQPALFYPSPMMQHYNPAHAGFMDLQQFVNFNGLNPTNTFKPTGPAQIQRFNGNLPLANSGNKSRNRSRDSGQRTPASNPGPPTPQGSGGSSVHATYVPQPNPRLFGPPQSAASPSGALQQQSHSYASQLPHNSNNSTLHYTSAYHPHMPPNFHHHHHQQHHHPVVSMAASVLPPTSSASTSSSPSINTTFQQQDATNVVSHHANTSASNTNASGSTSNTNSNSLGNQYPTNTALISSSTSSNNNNSNNTISNNSAPSPTSSSSLLREDSARSSPVHLNNSRNKTSNTPPLLPPSSINNNGSSEGRSHNSSAPLISHPPLITQENAPLMAIPPQSLHANAQNMPPHRNKYNNSMHFNSHHNNQRSQYSGQAGNMHHRNYPPYIYGQPNHYPMARDNMPARQMGRNSGGGNGGGSGGGRSNRGRQQRPRDDDGHYHQMSGGGNSGSQMGGGGSNSGGHHQHHGGNSGPPPRMGGGGSSGGGLRNSTGGANGNSGSANNNSAIAGSNSQQSTHSSNDNNASNSPSNNNSTISNSNSRGNNSNGSRNQQSDRAAQHSSHDTKQAQFALESTSFPPLPGADESEPTPSIVADEVAPVAPAAQVAASQAVVAESVNTPRANFAWGTDVASTTNGQSFSDIMKKPRSEVAPTSAASSKPDESTVVAGVPVSSSMDATASLPGVSEVVPAVVTAAAIVANNSLASSLEKPAPISSTTDVAASPSSAVDSSNSVGAGSVGSKSTSVVAKDQHPQDVTAPNRQSNNGTGAKEQRARGGRNRRGENAQPQPKSFNKNGGSGNAAAGGQGKTQHQQPKQSSGNVQTSAPTKSTNAAVSTTASNSSIAASTAASTVSSSTAVPVSMAPAIAPKEEKDKDEKSSNKELGDDDGWITKKTKEPRSHRNERKNAGMSHISHRGGYGGVDYHGERREERAYYGRGQAAYKERDSNRDSGPERQQPLVNGNSSPPPAQRQGPAASTAPSKGKPVKTNIEPEAAKSIINAKDGSSVSTSTSAPTSSSTTTAATPVATSTPATSTTVVASPPAEAGEHVKTWANVAGQGSKKIVQTAAVQSQLERKTKDLALQEKEKERRAAAVKAPRGGGGVSRGSERGGYGGRGAGSGRGGSGFVSSSSMARGQRRPGEYQGSSYRGGRGGGGDRGGYSRENKDDHQPADREPTKREPVQYRDSQAASSTPVAPAAAAARAK